MKTDKGKTVKKENLPSKTCAVCGRPFTWRKKWESCWEDVKYCSERCRRSRGGQTAQATPSATMAPTAPSVSHSSFKAGRSPDINKSLRCQDLGNIVHLEHLNLEVPDKEQAGIFYGEGLGLSADPGSTAAQRGGVAVTWFNIGRQQFHISKGPEAQRTPLPVKLVLPNHAALVQRLELVASHLEGTQFAFEQTEGSVMVTDPFGQQFEVLAPSDDDTISRGIKDIVLPCAPGTAAAIGAFYKKFYMARVAYGAQDSMDSASVLFGPSSSLTFVEDDEYKTAEAAIGDFEGWHIAFYMANFSSVYDKVCDAGINLLDHKYNDKAPTLEDALKWSQFRMVDILAVDDSPEGCPTSYKSGDVLYSFGHEARSLYHPRYMRSLYNKGTNVYDDHGPNLI
ncbi:hypothetical protein WJX82_010318 [Trebouxia sp. C0006]